MFGIFIAEPHTCLEHCLDSNNLDIQFLWISSPFPPVTIHFRLNFDHFLPDSPSPHLLDIINVWPLKQKLVVVQTPEWKFKAKIARNATFEVR